MAGATDVGKKRTNNEDAFLILTPKQIPDLPLDAVLLAADGMGGHERGEVASGMVRDIFSELFSGQLSEFLMAYGINSSEHLLNILIPEIHANLSNLSLEQAQSEQAREKMGTTLTVALIHGMNLTIGHVGDSRAYLVREDMIAQLTEDHTMAHLLVKSGKMTEEEAAKSKYRNALSQALGASKKVKPEVVTYPLEVGDRILLCTDGLTRHVNDEEFVEIMQANEPDAACRALIDCANSRGGRDNITAVIAHIIASLEEPGDK
jgi:PPM family protein phosphatase